MNKLLNEFSIEKFLRTKLAWILLLTLVIIFTISSENFFSWTNLVNIINQNVYIIIASLGITFLMMSGAMDLSVGYVMSTCGVSAAAMLMWFGFPVWLTIVLTLLLSMFIALTNTFIAIKLKMQILVVSIATMSIFQGASYLLSSSKTISGFPDAFKYIGQGRIAGIPLGILIAVFFFLIMSFILNRTYFGRYVYALGGNEEAARLAGINVNRIRYIIAAMVGFFIGLGSLLLISRLGSAQTSLGPGVEFSVITGIFLGGVSIRGGEGKLSGVLAGILCIAILTNGMQLLNMNTYYQYVIKGVIMLSAIGFDVYQLNKASIEKKRVDLDNSSNPELA